MRVIFERYDQGAQNIRRRTQCCDTTMKKKGDDVSACRVFHDEINGI